MQSTLTLPVPIPNDKRKKLELKKTFLSLFFYFILICGASKCFIKDLYKTFWGNTKKLVFILIQLSKINRTGRVKLLEKWMINESCNFIGCKYQNEDEIQNFSDFSCHVTYMFQTDSTLYSCLNVKERLARNRREIWS